MNAEGGKQESKDKPGQQDSAPRLKELAVRKRVSRLGPIIACGVAFAVLSAWAGLYGNLGHTRWIYAASLLLVASTFGAYALRLQLKNHHWFKWQYNWAAFVVVVLPCAMWAHVVAQQLRYKETSIAKAPDFIPGTEFTHKELEAVFPFGYAVIYPAENKRFRYEVFKTGKVDWSTDLDRLTIEPNVSAGTVNFGISPLHAETPTGAFVDINTLVSCPFKKGAFQMVPIGYVGNNPMMHVAVLNDNQRQPVFALGMRIPPREWTTSGPRVEFIPHLSNPN